jgi:hypothetical protein
MGMLERQLLIASAVLGAVENFCSTRGSHTVERTVRHHAIARPAKASLVHALKSARAKPQ